MNIDIIKDCILRSDGFEATIGMEFISTPEPDTCLARLHVDKRNMQPFGYLSGGAILVLAETLAGLGSCALCPGCKCLGINVNANHMHSASEGETVTAEGRLLHKGAQTHVWRIDVKNEDGQLISTVNVTNFVKALKP